jgi:hypothetical protein
VAKRQLARGKGAHGRRSEIVSWMLVAQLLEQQ